VDYNEINSCLFEIAVSVIFLSGPTEEEDFD